MLSPRVHAALKAQPLAPESGNSPRPAADLCRIPGSHKLDADHPNQIWKPYEMATFHPDAVAAEGTAGSVLLFDCRLYHTKAPNDTDSERLAVQVRRELTTFLL